MSISAPPGQPSITETLGSSFRDGLPLMKKNAVPVGALIGLALIVAVMLYVTGSLQGLGPAVITHGGSSSGSIPPAFAAILAAIYLLIFIVSYSSIAASVRTIHPDFRMTVGRFFGTVGYGLLAGVLTMIAGLFLVIPAYWVGPKLLLMPYTYLLTGRGDVLKTTWDMTTGYYWQTVGLLLLSGFCMAIILDASFFACVFLAGAAPAAAIVLFPLAAAILVWTLHVMSLVHIRWTDGLLPRAGMPHGAAAVPA